ncbi:MAG TPA: carboxypeptidase-like regulatory domain-containing protein, partial [Prolixibacteraceae bacterium]|nr:carboxypeptidase-like regulatory domain-containing protein [Prolixibacteraceae bacterium]
MKLTFLFLVAGLMQVSASLYSQTTKLTLEMRNQRVVDVLETIEQQSEFRFAYSSEYINLNRRVSLTVNEKSIEETLQLLFKDAGITYVINDRHIMLYPQKMESESASGQQQKSVSGRVTDNSGAPLPGVTVVVKGTSVGTTTGANGNFLLNNVPANAVLVFSFVGMKTEEITIGNKSVLNLSLEEESFGIEEVVAVGYTRQNRRDVSSSIAKVDMKALENNPSSSLVSLLSGQAAGLQSVVRSGTPGAAGSGLVIRGNTSLSASDGIAGISNPLYIVDGIPMSLQDIAGFDVSQNDFLSTLNPNEIKSIDILKDAAATAIYGSRGANGVIVITTKRGVSGEPRFSASVTEGVIFSPEKLEVYIGEAERQEKLRMYEETLTNLFGNQAWVDVRNGLEVMGYMLPSVLTDKYNPAFNNAYNFQDMFYQSGFTQNYDLSMDGGSNNNSYRIGLSHYDEKGVLVGYGFSRSTLNASLVTDINKYLHNDFMIRYSFLDRKGGLNDYMKAMPTSPTNLPSSLFYRTPEELGRMSGELGEAYNKNVSHSLSMSDALRVKFSEYLSLDNQASVSLMFGANNYFIPTTARSDNKSYGQSQSSTNSSFNVNSVLNYHRVFNDHR